MRTRFLLALWLGLLGAAGIVPAGQLPEPTPGIPEDKSIAYRASAPLLIDGNLADWEGAAFKLVGRRQDVLRGEWTGPDDLTCTWSVLWDDTTFYFAAAIRDDVLVEATDSQQPWTGDCIFLYIDADVDGTIDNKGAFFLFHGQPAFLGMAGGMIEAANAEGGYGLRPGDLGENFLVAGGETNPMWVTTDFSYLQSVVIDPWIPKVGIKKDTKPLRMPAAVACADGSCGIQQ